VIPIGWFVGLIASILLLLFLIRKKSSTLFLSTSCVLFMVFGGLRYQLTMPKHKATHLIHKVNFEKPKETVLVITHSFKASGRWKNYKASIKQIEGEKASGSILLKVNDTSNSFLQKGEAYAGVFGFNALKKDAFSYGFNYEKYLLSQGITHRVWASSSNLIALPNQNNKWFRFIGGLQSKLNNSLKNQHLDSKVIQLTQALVLGNKKELDKQLSNDFAKAGVIHVLAISGLHIGFIYMLFVWLFKLVLYRHKHRIVRSVIVLLLLWLSVWFSGASASALRATTMFSCFEISRLLLRRQHPLNPLFLSVFTLFVVDPKIIFSVGFQLSVVAVASIIIGVPKLNALWVPKTFVGNYLWTIICVSLCAQIGLLPLSIYYFHQIPGLFLVANIPVMVCMPFIMGFAILIVFGSYFGILPLFVIRLYNWLVNLLITFVDWIASFEAFVLRDLYISGVSVLGCYLIFGYLRWWYSYQRLGSKYIATIIGATVSFTFVEKYTSNFKNEIWVLDNYKNTILTEVTSNQVTIFSEEKLTEKDIDYKIKPLLGELHSQKVTYHQLQHVYDWNDKSLLVIDDNFIPKIDKKIDVILISNSPKINVERLLENLKPNQVIIASNNKNYLKKDWITTCKKLGVSYFDVSNKGSLRLDHVLDNLLQ